LKGNACSGGNQGTILVGASKSPSRDWKVEVFDVFLDKITTTKVLGQTCQPGCVKMQEKDSRICRILVDL